jgi:hypothetical protein
MSQAGGCAQHRPGYNGVVVIVVDAANVVGSVPDGWWRDRAGATERLRDALATAGPAALPGADADAEIVLVVEGAARRVRAVPGIQVIAADRSGDDAIVEICRQHRGDETVVVTADRGLRDRVAELGARVVGPSALNISR